MTAVPGPLNTDAPQDDRTFLRLHRVDDMDPQAVCNDGSPGTLGQVPQLVSEPATSTLRWSGLATSDTRTYTSGRPKFRCQLQPAFASCAHASTHGHAGATVFCRMR